MLVWNSVAVLQGMVQISREDCSSLTDCQMRLLRLTCFQVGSSSAVCLCGLLLSWVCSLSCRSNQKAMALQMPVASATKARRKVLGWNAVMGSAAPKSKVNASWGGASGCHWDWLLLLLPRCAALACGQWQREVTM